MRLRPWTMVGIVASLAALAFGVVELTRYWGRPLTKGASHSVAAITSINDRTVADGRTAFDLKDEDCRLRVYLLANDNPNASFFVGALDGSHWQPVSQELQFGSRRETEVVVPASALPATGHVPLAIFEREDGQCSGTVDLIAHPTGIRLSPLWPGLAAFLLGLGGLLATTTVGHLFGKFLDWLGGKAKRLPRPPESGTPARGAEIKT